MWRESVGSASLGRFCFPWSAPHQCVEDLLTWSAQELQTRHLGATEVLRLFGFFLLLLHEKWHLFRGFCVMRRLTMFVMGSCLEVVVFVQGCAHSENRVQVLVGCFGRLQCCCIPYTSCILSHVKATRSVCSPTEIILILSCDSTSCWSPNILTSWLDVSRFF